MWPASPWRAVVGSSGKDAKVEQVPKAWAEHLSNNECGSALQGSVHLAAPVSKTAYIRGGVCPSGRIVHL